RGNGLVSSPGPPLAVRHGLRGAVRSDEPVEERLQGDALRGGPGRRAMRPAGQVGVREEVGLATDRPGTPDERPAGRGRGLGPRDRVGWRGRLLVDGAGPGPFERRLPAALALLLVGHGGALPRRPRGGKPAGTSPRRSGRPRRPSRPVPPR